MVYFIRMIGTNFVKIGYTSGDIDHRVYNLQTGCPRELQKIAVLEGDEYLEASYHLRYSIYKTDGGQEWFSLPDEILAEIKDLADPAGANQRTLVIAWKRFMSAVLISTLIITTGFVVWLSSIGYALAGIAGFVALFFLVLFSPIGWYLYVPPINSVIQKTGRAVGYIVNFRKVVILSLIAIILPLLIRHNNRRAVGRWAMGYRYLSGRRSEG